MTNPSAHAPKPNLANDAWLQISRTEEALAADYEARVAAHIRALSAKIERLQAEAPLNRLERSFLQPLLRASTRVGSNGLMGEDLIDLAIQHLGTLDTIYNRHFKLKQEAAEKTNDWCVTDINRTEATYSDKIDLVSFSASHKGGPAERMNSFPFPRGATNDDLVAWCEDVTKNAPTKASRYPLLRNVIFNTGTGD